MGSSNEKKKWKQFSVDLIRTHRSRPARTAAPLWLNYDGIPSAEASSVGCSGRTHSSYSRFTPSVFGFHGYHVPRLKFQGETEFVCFGSGGGLRENDSALSAFVRISQYVCIPSCVCFSCVKGGCSFDPVLVLKYINL